MKRISIFIISWLLAMSSAVADEIWIIPLKGAIGPATSDYVSREIEQAHQTGTVKLILLKMDTPGGLDSAMRDMIRSITTSHIPVATWVGPSGARAASAGTYILFASHIAAMAEATNLGAATPVSLGAVHRRLPHLLMKMTQLREVMSLHLKTQKKCLLKRRWKRKSSTMRKLTSKV